MKSSLDLSSNLRQSHGHDLLEVFFEQMPMGVAIFDKQLQLQRFNPTWANFIEQYTSNVARQAKLGVYLADLIPGAEQTLIPLFQRALAGQVVRQEAYQLKSDTYISYWDLALSPLVEANEIIGVVNVMIDMTEREWVKRELEQRAETHASELEALLKIHRQVINLEIEPLLSLVLTQLKKVVDYSGAAITSLVRQTMTVRAFQGEVDASEILNWQIPLKNDQVVQDMVESQKPVIIADIRDQSDYARAFRHTVGNRLETVYGTAHAWLGVPLITKGKVTGLLSLFHTQPDFYASYHARLVQAFAHHVAAALETDWLYQQVHQLATLTERDRLARSLHDRLAQTLGYINIQTSLIQEQLKKQQIIEATNSLQELKLISRETYTDVREAIFNLRTKVQSGRNFLPMLQTYIEEYELQHQITVELIAERPLFNLFSPEISVQLFYVTQEALNNVRKHAQASQVIIHFSQKEQTIHLTIQDDGCGFDLVTLSEGNKPCFGVEIMQERIESIGGNLKIESQLQQGTCLALCIPINTKGQKADETFTYFAG